MLTRIKPLPTYGRRRQWGSDRRTLPLPAMPPPITDRSIALGRLAMIITAFAWLAYLVTIIINEFVTNGTQGMRFLSEAVSYLLIMTLLTFSAMSYLLARQGFLLRSQRHRRVARSAIDDHFDSSMPTMTVLVPSYREDTRVIRQTLLSAALQEYPYLDITLLIDDPPTPTDQAHVDLLQAARDLPDQIAELLSGPAADTRAALDRFESRPATHGVTFADSMDVADRYDTAALFLEDLAAGQALIDHTDHFFADHILRRLANDWRTIATAARDSVTDGATLSQRRLHQLYRSLAWTFSCTLGSFERKQYVSLSDEPNKAMNLNSYIGLMGGSYSIVETSTGTELQPTGGASGDLDVADTDYILTLDADSVLLPEYCLRLVHLLEQPEHQRVAVTQTPYSAYPGAATRLERLAGATTDTQHILHQGMTEYGATFWVGANAVLRKRALDDIMEVEHDGTRVVRRYIQDRTPIEDTESSIDLVINDWSLINYPERLSYSATPPDFGALVIQRARWANGGLLILPKMWASSRDRRRRGDNRRIGEIMLRLNYMASVFWASIGLLLLLAYPYSDRLLSPLVLLTALPYFIAMSGDLKSCGYKRTDVFRIYGFNLILLPVNLSGSLRSLSQAVTGKKIAFARTPKVRDRTTAPILFVLFPFALITFSVYTVVRDLQTANYAHAAFASFNALACLWALVALVGVRNACVDVVANIVDRLYQRERPARYTRRRTPVPEGAAKDWRQVLDLGADIDPMLVEPPRIAGGPAPATDDSEFDDLARSLAILFGGDAETGVSEVRLHRQDGKVVVSITGSDRDAQPVLAATA